MTRSTATTHRPVSAPSTRRRVRAAGRRALRGAPRPARPRGGVRPPARRPHSRRATMTAEPLVTISAPYGAGGSRVGPLLAERLDVPFAERVMRRHVADRVAGPLSDADRAEQPVGRSLGRILRQIAGERPPATPPATRRTQRQMTSTAEPRAGDPRADRRGVPSSWAVPPRSSCATCHTRCTSGCPAPSSCASSRRCSSRTSTRPPRVGARPPKTWPAMRTCVTSTASTPRIRALPPDHRLDAAAAGRLCRDDRRGSVRDARVVGRDRRSGAGCGAARSGYGSDSACAGSSERS